MSANTFSKRERSLIIALGLCIIDVTVTGVIVTQSNSLTILGDFFKECGDAAAVLAALLTMRAVRRQPTAGYAYGIGKLENLVSITIAALMFAAATAIAFQAFHHFLAPVKTSGTLPGIVMFVLYACIAFSMAIRHHRLLKSGHSAIIASQAKLWFSKGAYDLLMALSLIMALVFERHDWSMYLDPLASFVGVAVMLHSAWSIASDSAKDLLDAALEEVLQMRIVRCLADHFDDYDQFYKVRTRRSGSRIFVEVFLEFDPNLKMKIVRETIDRIRNSIEKAVPGADVTIIPAPETIVKQAIS